MSRLFCDTCLIRFVSVLSVQLMLGHACLIEFQSRNCSLDLFQRNKYFGVKKCVDVCVITPFYILKIFLDPLFFTKFFHAEFNSSSRHNANSMLTVVLLLDSIFQFHLPMQNSCDFNFTGAKLSVK